MRLAVTPPRSKMPQSKTETIKIGDFSYEVGKLNPYIATDLILDIIKIIAPSLAPLAAKAMAKEKSLGAILDDIKTQDSGNAASTVMDTLESGLLGMVDRFDKTFLREAMTSLAGVTTVHQPSGKSPELGQIFETHFRGELGAMFKWFGFALKVQYAGLFGSEGLSIGRVVAAVKAAG